MQLLQFISFRGACLTGLLTLSACSWFSQSATEVDPAAETTSESKDGKLSIPRLEGADVRASTRVLPEIQAKEIKDAGSSVACRVEFLLNVDGEPDNVSVVDCKEDYAPEVLKAAEQWRFELHDGSAFSARVRIVREIRFNLQ